MFHFRRVIPTDLRDRLRRRELVRSLGACDARTARILADQLYELSEQLFDIARTASMLTDNQLALLLCLGFGSIIAMPLSTALAGRFGCRAVMLASAAVRTFALPSLAMVGTVPALAIALAVFGASVGTLDVVINIQAVMVEKDSGRSMMSGFHGLFSLGGIFGAGGMTLMVGAGLSPWAATIAMSVAITVLMASAYVGLLPYGKRDPQAASLFVLPKGKVLFIGVLAFVACLVEGAILDWSALFLIRDHLFDPAHAGIGYAMFAATMTLGRLTGDRLIGALGSARVIVVGGVMSAAGLTLAVIAPNPFLAVIGFLLVGLGLANAVPVLFSAAGRQAVMLESQAVGAVLTMAYAGILTGPAVIGAVSQHLGLGFAFLLLAAGMTLVAASGPSAVRKQESASTWRSR